MYSKFNVVITDCRKRGTSEQRKPAFQLGKAERDGRRSQSRPLDSSISLAVGNWVFQRGNVELAHKQSGDLLTGGVSSVFGLADACIPQGLSYEGPLRWRPLMIFGEANC